MTKVIDQRANDVYPWISKVIVNTQYIHQHQAQRLKLLYNIYVLFCVEPLRDWGIICYSNMSRVEFLLIPRFTAPRIPYTLILFNIISTSIYVLLALQNINVLATLDCCQGVNSMNTQINNHLNSNRLKYNIKIKKYL